MADRRFDTTPLTARPRRSEWRRFRDQAVAGEHGRDLAAPSGWRRAEYPLAWAFVSMLIAGALAGLLVGMGVAWLTLTLAVVNVGVLLFLAWAILWRGRHDFWGPAARARWRLREFAGVNGLGYAPEPSVSRLRSYIFDYAPTRRHVDRFEVPGPYGFAVANYEEVWDDGPGESDGYDSGYAVFALRESYPHTLIARRMHTRIKALTDVEPCDGPAGRRIWSTKPDYPLLQRLIATGVVDRVAELGQSIQIEIVGQQLFVLRPTAHWDLASTRLWTGLASVAEALEPFATPGVPDAGGALMARTTPQ